MNRRNVLIGAGSIGAATVGGAALLSGSAAAEGDVTFEIDDVGGEVTSDDGSLGWLAVGLQGAATWENFDDAAETFDFEGELEVTTIVDGSEEENNGVGGTTAHAESRDIDDGFGRDIDEGESGTDGHFTFHVPNPDGSGYKYEEGTQSEDGDNELDGPTWTIVQDEDFRNAVDAEDLGEDWDLPDAVDPSYQYPENPIHAEDLHTGEADQTITHEFDMGIEVTLRDDVGDELETISGSDTFSVDVKHDPEGNAQVVATGAADAGAGK